MKKYVGLLITIGWIMGATCSASDNTCFRCLKSSKYGAGSYPHQIERLTCNLKTENYLSLTGFRCVQAALRNKPPLILTG